MTRAIYASILTVGAWLMAPLAAHAAQAQAELPDGPGKPLVQAICTTCHQVNMIQNSSGYTREHWQELISYMADLKGRPELATITEYLAKNFPPNDKRKSVQVAGTTKIAIKSWTVPTLGQRARDPVETPDGMIWYNGQFGNLIGRINPKTNEIKEWVLPPQSLPHSITPDAAGNIWYTGNGNGTVGHLDPKTGDITVFKMPDPAAVDPHTAIFDKNGTLYFTLQQANMLGRLVPSTGEIKLVKMPRPRSLPYGIKQSKDGALWVSCNGSNCIAKVDPVTMEIKIFNLPQARTTVRRLALDSNDTVWFVNSGLGYVGRLDPKTGVVKEWPSPSGRASHPYAIEVVNDVIWYNESGVRPDMLVRFDPKTEKFQSWPIASGHVYAGIGRHFRKTQDGNNLLIHQSGTNHIMLVSIDPKD